MNLVVDHLKRLIVIRETEIKLWVRENMVPHKYKETYAEAIKVNLEFIKDSKKVISILETPIVIPEPSEVDSHDPDAYVDGARWMYDKIINGID